MSDIGAAGPPLYQQIKQALRDLIAGSAWDSSTPFITQREICERYGVSTATAVRVLNELAAEGVLVRRQGRGTFVAEPRTATAEQRPADQVSSIACIMHGQGPHRAAILRGVQQACAEHGFRLLLFDSAGRPDREAAALQDAAAAGVAGVVLYPVQGQPNAALLRAADPLVVVDRYRPDVATDAVVADNHTAGYEITNELIKLGHRRIATLWHETQCTAVRDRLAGHIRALQEHNLPHVPDLTVLTNWSDDHEDQRRARLQTLLAMDEPPTVLLCSHGYIVATAINDLLGLGVDIPDEVDVASLDDAGPYDLLPVSAAAAVMPSQQMGHQAVEILAGRIGGTDGPKEHLVLPVKIKTRESAPGHLRIVGRTDKSGSIA